MIRHCKYYVYILEDKNNSFYTGYTNNINKRLALHNSGKGAKYLKGRRPLQIVFLKEYSYFKNAVRAERRIKKYRKNRKKELTTIYARSSTTY